MHITLAATMITQIYWDSIILVTASNFKTDDLISWVELN